MNRVNWKRKSPGYYTAEGARGSWVIMRFNGMWSAYLGDQSIGPCRASRLAEAKKRAERLDSGGSVSGYKLNTEGTQE